MKISLKFRLMASFMLVGFILFIVGGFGFYSQSRQNKTYSQVITESSKKMNLTNSMVSYAKESSVAIMQTSGHIENKSKIFELKSDFKNWAMKFSEINSEFQKLAQSESEKESYDVVKTKWGNFEKLSLGALSSAELAVKKDDILKSVNMIVDDVDLARIEMNDAIMNFSGTISEESEKKSLQANVASTKSTQISFLIVIIGFLASIAVGWFNSKSIVNKFNEIMTQISQQIEIVNDAIALLAASNQKMNTQFNHQVSSINQTQSACEEISQITEKTADSTKSNQNKTHDCSSNIEKAALNMTAMKTSVHKQQQNLNKIDHVVKDSQKSFADIVELVKQIQNKTQVMNEIVFQTKLLSFNASVEAARAGEHGRGFSVVAEEIGNLAKMSGQASTEIENLISDSVSQINQITQSMQSGVQTELNQSNADMNDSLSVVSDCDRIFQSIKKDFSFITESSNEIQAAAVGQIAGIQEINTCIVSLNSVATEYSHQAKNMNTIVEEFQSSSEILESFVTTMKSYIYGQVRRKNRNSDLSDKTKNQSAFEADFGFKKSA